MDEYVPTQKNHLNDESDMTIDDDGLNENDFSFDDLSEEEEDSRA